MLPVVIVAGREAIRAVPPSIREGSMALGRDQVADDLEAGAAGGAARDRDRRDPRALAGDRRDGAADRRRRRRLRDQRRRAGLFDDVTALPIQIFSWISDPQEEYKALAAAGIIVLMVILLAMNAVAIWLRNKYEKKW